MDAPQPTFDLTCAVPRSGRTLRNFLQKLKELGADTVEIDAITGVLDQGKALSSPDLSVVMQRLREISAQAPSCFSVFIDRKRATRPYRIGFLGYEWNLGGHRVRVEGEEPHNGSSLIRLDEVDFTIVGLDELLSMTQYYLRDPTTVTKWGMYNYHLEKPTGIRIAGSAMLRSFNSGLQEEVQDIVGFFLISKPGGRKRRTINWETLSRHGQRVFVKGRYTGIIHAAYPGLRVISVEDVEDAVMEAEAGSVGIEIVQSGNTLRRKGLQLHGSPLFLSESLYVVDYDRYLSNPGLRKLVESLQPIGYFEDSRICEFAKWYAALEYNLGENWLDRPEVTELLCGPNDVMEGLRPYRLQTRRWKPDDAYQRDQADALVEQARQTLKVYYDQVRERLKSPPVAPSTPSFNS